VITVRERIGFGLFSVGVIAVVLSLLVMFGAVMAAGSTPVGQSVDTYDGILMIMLWPLGGSAVLTLVGWLMAREDRDNGGR
jgi:hypothetical protein